LIQDMSLANPFWGAPRIHGELLKLGIEVGQTSVAKYMARRRGGPSQGWRTFLCNHADGIASIDLFVVPTLSFRLLYGFLILRHRRRRIIWLGVTANPTAEWIARHVTEACGWEAAPDCIVRGGRPGHCLAERLSLPVSKDTLLRVVRRHAALPDLALGVVGIDDFAWRRGCRYGTVICDLERRRIVALLADRQSESVAVWLRRHPSITFVARDRGANYGEAATKGAPQAIQVADRWHLVENASTAFLDIARQHMQQIRETLRANVVDPATLTCAERRQWEGYRRRKEITDAVLALARAGTSIKEIVRRLGLARMTVRRIVRGGGTDMFRSRMSTLEPHLATLDAYWRAGCHNASEIWRRLRDAGFAGSSRVVAEWAKRRRLDEAPMADRRPRKPPSARMVARLLTTERDRIPAAFASTMALIEQGVPTLLAARDLLDRFHAVIRTRAADELDAWITAARESPLSSFANGIATDRDSVRAALVHPWSNGQTEGQITKLKLVKRQMYGRAKLDLLTARLLGTA
jgi:transposase